MLPSCVVQQPETCLDDNIIAAYVDGDLEGGQVVEVESHIDSCDQCRTHVSSLAAAPTVVTATDEPVRDLPPSEFCEQIGPYRLLHPIGVGGMGEVYEAEQLEPVQRPVALKIVKQGLDSKEVMARFDAERQALALMEHPYVAKVFDGGTSPGGRPYFVMELVRGVPITAHCDKENFSIRQRLELFLKVCEGVQHAHHKAIIHRDLKPSNILVSTHDGKASPKIIDFGVAKALTRNLTDRTLHTEIGKLVGTLAYMSPEQARRTGEDIDTRADVYSLGVILYELLVGVLPFELTLRGSDLEVVLRKIREELPPIPSTRLTMIGDKSTTVLRNRDIDVHSLRRQLKGDLDWITMKALEKDCDRRYGSAQELGADILRFLNDQPVLASPPTARYRASKFIRRHRLGVGAAATGFVVLVAFAATMTVQAERIKKQRDRANREATRANSEAERANVEEAAPLMSEAYEAQRRISGEDYPDTLYAMNNLASLYTEMGRNEEAEKLFKESLELKKKVLGPNHPDTLSAMIDVANLVLEKKQYAEAEELYVSALAAQKIVLGADHPSVGVSMHNLACMLRDMGRHAESDALFAESLEIFVNKLGPDHPVVASSVTERAKLKRLVGQEVEAKALDAWAAKITATQTRKGK